MASAFVTKVLQVPLTVVDPYLEVRSSTHATSIPSAGCPGPISRLVRQLDGTAKYLARPG